MRLLLYLVFILSGAAGLMYESIWARYLGLFVGHAAYAQVLTIGIFLGGMALGAMLVGSRSERLADPLKWYAGVELVVGAVGLFFHEIYGGVTGFAYATLFPALGGGVSLTLAKWIIAGGLILPQSILLGTTFPLMGAGVLRRHAEQPGRTLAILYFANSLGAAVGVLVAGFYLLRLAGLPGTLLVAAMLNLVAALGSGFVAHQRPAGEPVRETAPGEPVRVAATDAAALGPQQLLLLLLGVSFGTAVASFIYEIAWLRMLALVLGSATHSFELMLSAFILGLALGSFWVRRRADRWSKPLRALGIVQWIMGCSALATLPLYVQSFSWMADLMQSFARTDGGYEGLTIARYALCLAVMLPSTFCAGITLPLITRTLLTSATGERAIGSVYGVNTLGSIFGVALAGLVLMPLLGVRLLLVAGAALDMAIGVLILRTLAPSPGRTRSLAYAALAATVLVALAASVPGGLDERVMGSGVFRTGRRPSDDVEREYLFYQDGRTATVAAWRRGDDSTVAIATNGKVDGSLPGFWLAGCTDTTARRPLAGDYATQSLTALYALAHAPRARAAAVIGHGTGMSSHFLLGGPSLEEVVTIEIEPEMVLGSRVFYPANRRVFDDPRSDIVIEDARTYMASANRQFDIILSEPSNPWVSGVASLFTSEFYGRVSHWLGDGGVFGQWFQLYELNDGLVLSMLAALHEHFADYEIFLTNGGDMLIVATTAPALPPPDWSVFELEAVREDYCHTVLPSPEALEAARVTHRAVLLPLLAGFGQPNSDFYPVLDLGAERARYLARTARGFATFATERVDIGAPVSLRRFGPATSASASLAAVPRQRALALSAALRDSGAAAAVDSLALPRGLDAARYRALRWGELLGAGEPPSDWRFWLAEMRDVEQDLHRGSAGFVDESFYTRVQRILERHDGPGEARRVVEFYRGLRGWDFGIAAEAADALIASGAAEDGWIPRRELLEGAVVARLRVGDFQRAGEIYDELAPPDMRAGADLRLQLLGAYVDVVLNGARR